jgi:beta-galactosidase/beta-glucuronidase
VTQNKIEISVGDLTDMEAQVYARFRGAEPAILEGTIRGPFCDRGRTLPADFLFRAAISQPASAEALITEPCLWTPEMPHLYRVDIVAKQGDDVVAEYHEMIGLNRLSPRRPVDFAPGTG